jgi:hypothetical protein
LLLVVILSEPLILLPITPVILISGVRTGHIASPALIALRLLLHP